MKKSGMKTFLQITTLIIGMVVLLTAVSLYTHKDGLKKSNIVEHVFTKQVEQHRSTMTKYAEEYEVEEYVDVLLAMMMQESGGRGDDPMQSSESLCGEVGCIEEPADSIKQGVAYFSKIMDASDGDVQLSVQAYNFGIGFVHYVRDNGDGYDQDITIEFSKKMYKEAEDQSMYTCLRKEAEQFDACYGDIYYARDVMAYKSKFAEAK